MRFLCLGLLWLVFCDASSWLSPDLDRALGTAALEVTQMSRRFERLRREIASVPRSTLERLLEGLSTSEVDLLKGQGEGKVLEERFVELQSQGASLLKSIRCAQNSSLETSDTFSLLEVSEAEEESGERSETEEAEDAEDAEDEEESDEDEDSEELEDPNEEDDGNVLGPEVLEDDEDSCLSAGNVTGYRFTEVSLRRGNFSVLVECFEPFTGVAEVMPCKGHLQEYELRGCSSPTSCSPAKDLQGYVITEASLVFEDFDVSATCEEGYQGKAMVQRCQSPGSPYDLKGCSLLPSPSGCGNWTTPEVQDLIQKLQSLAKDLSKHFGRISTLSNVSALPSTLGALRTSEALQQLQQAVATASERGKQQQALEVLRRQGAAVARLDPKSLEDEEDFEAISFELEAALVRLESSVDTAPNAPNAAAAAASLGQLNCNLDGLQRANGRFDEAVESFGTILPKMLPREVESLHRVLHSLEVLRHTLQGAPEASECQRYFSGVEQLESDLAHYRSLFNPPAAAAPTPPPPRPRAVPLQPGTLEPLELDLGRGPLPGGSRVGPTALDPRGFR